MQIKVLHNLFALICISLFLVKAALVDEHENCELWANAGECEKNPNYMLKHCSKAILSINNFFNTDVIFNIDKRVKKY